MQLIIDIGNTRTKLALFNQDRLVTVVRINPEEFDASFSQLLEDIGSIEACIIGATGNIPQGMVKTIQAHCPTMVLDHNAKLPFVNDYATPETLGVDRMALISAAAAQYPDQNILVIDAGTCVTYDFIDDKNHFKGGAISPGLSMRYDALHGYTAKLPDLEPMAPESLIGDSTANSIHSGVVYGLVNEIEGVVGRYNEQFLDLTVILTGGDAHFLLDHLKNGIFANSNFLLEGLNYLLTLNDVHD
ncbi:MAG: type III pantothenate kinase [Gilvibacter sp.]